SFAGEVWAWAGNVTESTTGADHAAGRVTASRCRTERRSEVVIVTVLLGHSFGTPAYKRPASCLSTSVHPYPVPVMARIPVVLSFTRRKFKCDIVNGAALTSRKSIRRAPRQEESPAGRLLQWHGSHAIVSARTPPEMNHRQGRPPQCSTQTARRNEAAVGA